MAHFCLILKQLAVDGAFGSYSEASGGRLASLAPQGRIVKKKNRYNIFENKKIDEEKKTEAENF